MPITTIKPSCRHRARRILLLLLILFGLLGYRALPVSAGNAGYNWYCVHTKGHVQPRADAQFDFIGRYGGYYIDKSEGHTAPDAKDKVVYLTFDAGYENGNVASILDTMKAEGVTGAFFILGNLVKSNPELVRRMADEGHLVCNHSYAHKDMTGWDETAFREELAKLETACREETGVAMASYFRPPEGRFNENMLKYAHNAGYKTIFWSFAYADWDNGKQPDPERAKAKVLDNMHNGAVILLHPTSATNAAILGDVIRTLKAQGYRFGTLDELTGAEEDTQTDTLPCPGGVPSHPTDPRYEGGCGNE